MTSTKRIAGKNRHPKSKICRRCKKRKRLVQFVKCASRPDGHFVYCLPCQAARGRARYHADPEGGRSRARRDYERDKPKAQKRSRNYNRLKYGATAEKFAAAVAAQKSRCSICKIHFSDLPARDQHADHCHRRNKFRGVLCRRCNVMLGFARDNPAVLRSAARYLCAK